MDLVDGFVLVLFNLHIWYEQCKIFKKKCNQLAVWESESVSEWVNGHITVVVWWPKRTHLRAKRPKQPSSLQNFPLSWSNQHAITWPPFAHWFCLVCAFLCYPCHPLYSFYPWYPWYLFFHLFFLSMVCLLSLLSSLSMFITIFRLSCRVMINQPTDLYPLYCCYPCLSLFFFLLFIRGFLFISFYPCL